MATSADAMIKGTPWHFSFVQEIFHSASHGIGLIGVLLGLPVLLAPEGRTLDAKGIAASAVFAASLLALYAASTIYHALRPSRIKHVFRVLDHSAIYLLIAGSYTPFTLGVLRGPWGWTLLALVWALAGLGILMKAVYGTRFPGVSTASYLLMGWLMVLAVEPLLASMPTPGILWLFGGGLFYTAGVAFFACDSRLCFAHTVWHFFVLAGSGCHFYAVLRYSGL